MNLNAVIDRRRRLGPLRQHHRGRSSGLIGHHNSASSGAPVRNRARANIACSVHQYLWHQISESYHADGESCSARASSSSVTTGGSALGPWHLAADGDNRPARPSTRPHVYSVTACDPRPLRQMAAPRPEGRISCWQRRARTHCVICVTCRYGTPRARRDRTGVAMDQRARSSSRCVISLQLTSGS
jgi:hypothetical protein